MRLSRFVKLLFGLLFFALIHSASVTNSGGRNDQKPCSDCHGGGNWGMMTLTGLPNESTPNTTYALQLCINDPINTMGVGGFRFHASQGTYSNVGSGVQVLNGGLTHAGSKPIMGGLVCWTFDWTAPASGNSNFAVYGNAANGDNTNNNADQGGYIYVVSIPTVDPCESNLVIMNNPIPTGTYQASNTIIANTPVESNATVLLDAPNLIDLQANFEVPQGAVFETLIGAAQGCLTEENPSSATEDNTDDK